MLFPFHQVRRQTLLERAHELRFIEGISLDLSNIQFCVSLMPDTEVVTWYDY